MLLKNNRVPRNLFPIVLKAKKKYTSKHVFVRVVEYNKTKTPVIKVSFVVSKKNVKKAIDRHKLRRLGYGVIKRNLNKLKKGYIVVFFFTKDIEKNSKKETIQEIEYLLEKAKLYIKK